MIRTYGLYWNVDHVDWNRTPAKAELRGGKTPSSRAVSINFKDQRGIYALYSEFELVYVGQTGAGGQRLYARLKSHLSDHLSERWDRFSWFGTQWVTQSHKLSADTSAVNVDIKKSLNLMEAVGIAISEPRLNLQRGRWGDAKQYFQIRDVGNES